MPPNRLSRRWRNIPLFWRLFAGFMLVNIITLTAVGTSISYLMRTRLLDAKEAALVARLQPLARAMSALGRSSPEAFIQAMKPLLEIDEAYWVAQDYVATHDTLSQSMSAGAMTLDPADMENLRQGYMVTKWLRHNLLSVPPLGVAVPLPQNGGVLLLSASLADVRATVQTMGQLLLLGSLGGTLLAAGLAFLLSRQIAAPLNHLNQLAKAFAAGNFSDRTDIEGEDEIGQVAKTLNLAADRIEATFEQQRALVEQQRTVVLQQQELNQLRRDFMANVSHEFRAPLASLRGYLELMLDGTVRQSEQRHVLSVMLDDSLRLGRLVDDLLDLARLQARRVTMKLEAVDVLDLMDRVLTAFESRAARKSLILTSEPPTGDPEASLPLVLGDEDRLIQVLTNLVDNALRFTPEHGLIEVTAREEGDFIRLAVRDTGRGIPPEELENIWERFYKVDKARTPGEHGLEGGGTGLGLAIVNEIVTALHGAVGCESQVGQGSTFWALLPKVDGTAEVTEEAPPVPE